GGGLRFWLAVLCLFALLSVVVFAAVVGGGVFSIFPFFFYFLSPLPPDQAGPADNHDLHDFTSQDGFETTATPEPLATGSLSMSIRKLSRMDRPILQPFAVCCTRAVSGHAPTAVPSSVMNSCLIRSPRRANEQLCRKAKPFAALRWVTSSNFVGTFRMPLQPNTV